MICTLSIFSTQKDVPSSTKKSRVVELDVDIGADAIDYKCVFDFRIGSSTLTTLFSAIANQESLSGLETEMRKLEALVKEVENELGYLKIREERFSSTNGVLSRIIGSISAHGFHRVHAGSSTKFLLVYHFLLRGVGCMANIASSFLLQEEVPHRLSLLPLDCP
jgi:hypothetical protein